MKLKQTVRPGNEPVTLFEAKEQLRIDSSDEDELIRGYIQAAREVAETESGNRFVSQTWEIALDEFPADYIELPMRPLISLDSIAYVDTDGNPQTWSSSNYSVDEHSFRPRITPVYGGSWPDIREIPNAVTITATLGYSQVPQRIKQAILLIVSDFYEYRVDTISSNLYSLPRSASVLLGCDSNFQY